MTRLVNDTLVMAERNLVRLPRAPDMLIAFTVQPIMFVLLFAYVFGGAIGTPGFDSYIDFLIPGIIAQNIAFGGFATALGLAEDMTKGLIDRFRSLPTRRAAVLAGRALADVATNTISIAVLLVTGLIIGFGFNASAWEIVAGIGLLLLWGFASSWIFALIGMSVSSPEAANGVGFTLVFPITFISAAFVPVESMPNGLEQVASANPVTQVVDAMRALWLGAPAGNSIWLAVVWCLALIAIFAPLAVAKYRRTAAKCPPPAPGGHVRRAPPRAPGGAGRFRLVSQGDQDERRWKRAGKKVRDGAAKLDSSPALMTATKLVRQLLPGDARYGDPLSTAGSESPQVLGRRLAQLTDKRPGAMREAGMGALQMWQAVSEAQGRGRGDTELTIVFTDLSDFSDWALDAGDDQAIELLRDVGQAIEPPVDDHGGRVVKRLGDGMMAVFHDPKAALDAVQSGRDNVRRIECDGYDPKLRAGLHVGRPRKIGGDYLGVDVNIAARLAENAGPGEILVSERVLAKLDTDGLDVRKKRRFKVKGVPKDLTAHAVR